MELQCPLWLSVKLRVIRSESLRICMHGKCTWEQLCPRCVHAHQGREPAQVAMTPVAEINQVDCGLDVARPIVLLLLWVWNGVEGTL